MPLVEGWAQVYAASDDVVAQLIRDNLRAEGVDAQVFSQKDHFAFAVDLGDLSPVRVLVPADEYEAAQRIVREHMDLRGELRFACPNCGEPFEPGATRCAVCGAPLPERRGRVRHRLKRVDPPLIFHCCHEMDRGRPGGRPRIVNGADGQDRGDRTRLIAEALELEIGSRIVRINGELVRDGIDFRFLEAESLLELEVYSPAAG